MGSAGNLSKLVIPKQHWQESKERGVSFKDMGPDSRTGASRSKVQWWMALSLCAFLVVVPLVMFVCAIDSIEVTASRQPWISLDGPPLEFIGEHSRWSLLRGRGRGVVKRAAALQGMGTLHRTGTRAMQEVIVAHLTEDTTSEELRLFLRSLHRSGATAKADTVLLFPSMTPAMADVIREEEDSFQKLLLQDQSANSTTVPFNSAAFRREPVEDEVLEEIIWGKRHDAEETGSSTFGSVVSFEVQELDPQDALQGFFDTPPVQLRRWVCYDMLLGMIKSRFKNVLLSQVKGVFVLGDALSATRKKQTLYITAEDMVWRDAKREPVAEIAPQSATVVDLPSIRRSLRESSSSEESPGLIQSVYGPQVWNAFEEPAKQHVVVSPAVIMGGVQYVRGLANKMTSEIVRVALERKSRRTFHDKAVLNMWIHKKPALGKRIADHLKVVKNHDSVVHSVQGSRQPSLLWRKRDQTSRYLVVVGAAPELREELCRLDSTFYRRCE